MDQFNQQPNTPRPNIPPPNIPTPSTPPMNTYGGGMGEEHKSSVGPIVGSIIVVLVIVLGGLYLYGSQFRQEAAPEEGPAAADINALPDEAAASLQSQGATDSLSEIEADLGATNVDNLDADVSNVGSELNNI